MKDFYVLLILFFFFPRLHGQNDTLRSFGSSIGVKSNISHTGVSLGIQYKIRKNNLILAVGPKTELDRNVRFYYGPVGLTSDLEIILLESKRLESSVNLDYQLLFVEKECNGTCRERMDRLHEYTAGFGLRIKAGKRMYVINRVNVGRYTESLYSSFFRSYLHFSDFNTMVLLGLEVKL